MLKELMKKYFFIVVGIMLWLIGVIILLKLGIYIFNEFSVASMEIHMASIGEGNGEGIEKGTGESVEKAQGGEDNKDSEAERKRKAIRKASEEKDKQQEKDLAIISKMFLTVAFVTVAGHMLGTPVYAVIEVLRWLKNLGPL